MNGCLFVLFDKITVRKIQGY